MDMKQVTELQNLNDKIFKIVDILKRKESKKEHLTVQSILLEEIAEDMREVLNNPINE